MTERARLTARLRDDLTPRQREVMELIAAGKTNFEIAQALDISLEGAKYHVSEILARLGVESREEAVALWRSSPRRWRTRLRRFWLPAASGLAGAAAAGVIAVALFSEDEPSPDAGAPPVQAVDLATAEAWVAWVSQREGQPGSDLHIQRASQPGVEQFHEPGFEAWYGPRWSPDGHYLAVIAATADKQRLLLFDRSSGSTHTADAEVPKGPLAWKPDGRAVSYAGESGVVTFDLTLKEILRSDSPPSASISATVLDGAWSPDGDHLALLAYGNVLVMDESGHFAVVDASAVATEKPPATGRPNLLLAGNHPTPLTWDSDDSFSLFVFPGGGGSGEDIVRVRIERDGRSWRARGPDPAVFPAAILAPGDRSSRGLLVGAYRDGHVQAQSSIGVDRNSPDPSQPAHWALLHVISSDRVFAEFKLPNVILGPGSARRDFDVALVPP